MASKPKPALSEWLIVHRKERGDTVADTARVTDRSEATVRGWEAGRPPSADDPVIAHLERYYGAVAPKDADQSDLVSALKDLVEELRLSREEQGRWNRAVEETLAAVIEGRIPGAPRGAPASRPPVDVPR